jgi:hypothetical protein
LTEDMYKISIFLMFDKYNEENTSYGGSMIYIFGNVNVHIFLSKVSQT